MFDEDGGGDVDDGEFGDDWVDGGDGDFGVLEGVDEFVGEDDL